MPQKIQKILRHILSHIKKLPAQLKNRAGSLCFMIIYYLK